MARRPGDSCAVEISTDGGSTWNSFGCFTGFDTNQAKDYFDATCGGDTNKIYTAGKKDFSGSAGFVWDDADDTIFDAVDDPDPQLLRLIPNKVTSSAKYYQGLFYLDLSLNVGNDTIRGTVNFRAAGNIAWN